MVKQSKYKSIMHSAVAIGFSFFLFGCDLNSFKSIDDLKASTRQSMNTKNYSDAASTAQKLVEKAPKDYEAFFLLAQAKAQAGDKNAALVALEQAIKNGLKDDVEIDKNTYLEPIKSMNAYIDLMNVSFPNRVTSRITINQSSSQESSISSGDVSIRESNGKREVRAGDVVIQMQTAK
jgi:tetratricopeptide (TPR) repeat protein